MGLFQNWFRKGKEYADPAAAPPGVITAARWVGNGKSGERLFTVAHMPDGSRQAFYQSTGRNSSMAGRWLPCDGMSISSTSPANSVWVEKSRFIGALSRSTDNSSAKGGPLHRFGSQEALQVSLDLDKMPIRVVASFSSPKSLNTWLAKQGFPRAEMLDINADVIQKALGVSNPHYSTKDPDPHDPEDLPAAMVSH